MGGRLRFRWGRAALLVVAAAAAGLAYNSVDGIQLAGAPDTARRAIGGSLPQSEGIHLVGLDIARRFVERRTGPVIDARSPEQYREGRIPGAYNCYVYELQEYLPPLLEKISLDDRLLIYCSGADCEDSRMLAQTMQEMGFRYLYVFEGGFDGWSQAGLTVDTGTVTGAPTPDKSMLDKLSALAGKAPEAVWLAAEIALLAFGVWVVLLISRGRLESGWLIVAAKLAGVIFVLASLHKIASPLQFARIVDNYQILPPLLVNPAAIVMPWMELLCGLLLLIGRYRQSSALILAALTLVFIAAIAFNMARGLEFDCGCFGDGHTPPWRLLLRDIGLLCCCVAGMTVRPDRTAAQTGN